ncbi:MAG TPA: hypothetical protein VIH63_15785 [Xanthobacteraceae bacterium]
MTRLAGSIFIFGIGQIQHPVTRRVVGFLANQCRSVSGCELPVPERKRGAFGSSPCMGLSLSLVAAFVAVAIMATTQVGAQQPQKPNILFILADNIGYGDIGAYGGGELPAPDRHNRSEESALF